ncbi:MAG: LamG domain-containing protein, partial [Kiritimatiellae bacterium]|nr:LamG domain-containing protein [Kiritimatiellia bacterium]
MALGTNTSQSIALELPNLPLLFVRVDEIARSTPLDSDSDGLDDLYELSHAAVLDPLNPDDAGADADGDELSALQEKAIGTNPGNPDTDEDGMPDGWEAEHELNPLVNDAAADPDNDDLPNLGEYLARTDPHNRDTDSDGLTDGWEIIHEFNPLSDGGVEQGLIVRLPFDEGDVGIVPGKTRVTSWTGVLRFMVASNWVDGLGGKALWFDGVNDYVSVDQSAGSIITGAPFTVMATVWRETDSAEPYPTILSDGQWFSGSRWPGYLLRYQSDLNSLRGLAGSSNSPTPGVSMASWSPDMDNQWVNLALTHDGTTCRLFVNGRLAGSVLSPFDAVNNTELFIGCGHVNQPDSYWKGKIDDVRFFRTALESNQLGQVNEWIGDADEDGLINGVEFDLETDPQDADSDEDGLSDYDELLVHGTSPIVSDTDADGLPDGWELAHGMDPQSDDAADDPDLDGLTNLQEYQAGTDPRDADSDDDTLSDYQEVIVHGTNPLSADTDADGLPD